MLKKQLCVMAVLLLAFSANLGAKDNENRPETNKLKLNELSKTFSDKQNIQRPQRYYELLNSTDDVQLRLNGNRDIKLMYLRENGSPVYYETDNLSAARTISTDDVWPGGSGGFSLSGAGTGQGKLGEWDAGGILLTHQEFGGRVAQVDSPGATHYHSTHVAGTLVAAGVQANAKGMSYEAYLNAYDWDNDVSEMASAGAMGMNVSNHSYGAVTGWYNDGTYWYWYGDVNISTVEDYGFGFYGDEARAWDQVAYNAPYYLICKSAGNDRNDTGPTAGGGHYVWIAGNWAWRTDVRDPDGGTDHYDCIGWYSTAKNVLTVGAVDDYPNGYNGPGSVVMSTFSSWGPCDDGRIKPDIVANGVSLYSCSDGYATQYASLSGTSMSTPNAAGSANLLFRHYETTHNSITPLASTIKGIIIHTADESGTHPGPDYRYGWGMMNTLKAANIVTADITEPDIVIEESLQNGATNTHAIYSDGVEPLRVTICWTDPAGTPPPPSLNPTTPMLVNDLDIRLEHLGSSTIYEPYMMDPTVSRVEAFTGDNHLDNVEMIYVETPPAGDYELRITHKGTLASDQWYSLITTTGTVSCHDTDNDGYGNPGYTNTCPEDNCPDLYNPEQNDPDGDGLGSLCDNCAEKYNPYQEDTDLDGIGDACDYVCGNVDNDELNHIDILDIVYLINYVYKGGGAPYYLQSADVNTDGNHDILDIVRLINFVYKNGPDPVCE